MPGCTLPRGRWGVPVVVGLVILGRLEVAYVGLSRGDFVCGRGSAVFVGTVRRRI